MTTTLRIDEEVYREAKAAVAREGITLTHVYALAGSDVNDTYLAALEHGATLVSAGKGFGRFEELKRLEPTTG